MTESPELKIAQFFFNWGTQDFVPSCLIQICQLKCGEHPSFKCVKLRGDA
jgi:hypothetical protein